jgi:hypothetical protein
MLNRRSLVAAAIAASAGAAGNALAQGQPIVGIQTVTTYSSDGRISAVDPNARTVTIAFPNGATRTHNVSPTVANFSAARIGDTVSVGFEDRLTFVLSGPNTRTPRERNVGVAAAAASGQRVTGVGAATAIANWWVVGVDPNAGTLTLVDPDSGPVRTFKVETQAGREQLPRVKVGDSLTAINSQVLVISIAPKA